MIFFKVLTVILLKHIGSSKPLPETVMVESPPARVLGKQSVQRIATETNYGEVVCGESIERCRGTYIRERSILSPNPRLQ